MTLPSFGIPEADAALEALHAGVTANDDALEPVANAVGSALATGVRENGSALSQVGTTLSRRLSSGVGANTRSLTPVVQTLDQSLAASVAAQGGQLAQLPLIPSQLNPNAAAFGLPMPPVPAAQGLFARPPGGGVVGQIVTSFTPLAASNTVALHYSNFTMDDWHSWPILPGGDPNNVQYRLPPVPAGAIPVSASGPPNGYIQAFLAVVTGGTPAWYAYYPLGAPSPSPEPGPLPPIPEPLPQPQPQPEPQPTPGPTPITDQCIPICGITPSPGASPPPALPPAPPGSPPPPPPPLTIPPAPSPVPAPGIAPTFNLIIPLPGSPQWCAALPEIAQFFSDYGSRFLSWASDSLGSVESLLLSLAAPPDEGDWSLFGNVWTGILRDFIGPSCAAAASAVHDVRNVISAINSGFIGLDITNAALAIGVWGFKALWNAVKNLELGSEVWIFSKTKLGEAFPEFDTILEYLTNTLVPIEVPAPPEAMEALLQGQITRQIYECWLLIHGCHPDIYEPVLRSRRDKLQTIEAIQYVRRNGGGVDVQVAAIQALGWYSMAEAQQRVFLYDELPTIADHLHWLQRNVFDAAYVQEFALMDGFEEKFWPTFGADLYALGMKKEYAALHYAAHWLNPAPEQLKEMVYRLRPEKYGQELSFTSEQYARVLAEQDVGPFFRPRFQEIIHRVPALGYLRDMYRQYIVSDEDMKGYHRDLGYSESDSIRFVAIDSVVRSRMRATESHGWNPSAIASAYSIRQLDSETVIQLMEGLGYYRDEAMELMERADAELKRAVFMRARSRALTSTVTEVRSAIRVGVISADTARKSLTDAGWPYDYAVSLVSTEELSAGTERIKQVIAAVRRAYLRGETTAVDAGQTLGQIGVTQQAIDNYLTIWALQLTPTRRRRTAAQIVADVTNGAMDTAEALLRLMNLGYDDADSRLYMADAQRKISTRQAQMLAKQQRSDRAAQALLAREAIAAQRQARAAIKRLEKIAPVSKLQKWARLGIIAHGTFLNRMKLYGYDLATAETHYKEACSGKTAQCTETQTNGLPIGPGEPGVPGP